MGLPLVSSQNMSPEKTSNIIGFIRNLVPKRFTVAIKTLLQPCCPLTIASASFVNVSGSTYNVTVNLSTQTSFYEIPTIQFIQNGQVLATNGIFSGSTVVTFSDVVLIAGSTTIAVQFLTPVASSGDIGVYQLTPTITVVAP